jgi:macrodomain Ter protein organizer (MatP/YcbG family)
MVEDTILALGLYRYGYGFWELMRNDIRNDPRLSFNWIAKSRSVTDIQKRCDQLIQRFKKEFLPEQQTAGKKAKDLKSTFT